jgi:hypothetical protein
VLFGVHFGGVVLVLGRMQTVTVRYPGMMRGLFVIASFVMLGRLAVMLCRLLVMMRRLLVMLVNLVFRHVFLPDRCFWLGREISHIDEPFANDERSRAAPGFAMALRDGPA